MGHFNDEVNLQFENVLQFIQHQRWRHIAVNQNMFGSVPHKRYFKFWMFLQQPVQVLT